MLDSMWQLRRKWYHQVILIKTPRLIIDYGIFIILA